MKRCSKCKVIKSKKEFGSRKNVKDNLRSWCKSCENKSSTKWAKNNHIRVREHDRHTTLRTTKLIKGKVVFVSRLNKRPHTKKCEICNKKRHTTYHHWDNKKLSMGLWICYPCHFGCEFVEKKLHKIYLKLKKKIGHDKYYRPKVR